MGRAKLTDAINRDRQHVKARCVIPVISPSGETNAGLIAEKLRDWAEDEGYRAWRVAITGLGAEVDVSNTYAAGALGNGTLTAAAWFATELDRALDSISQHRWYGELKLTATLLESRDEALPDDEDDQGDDD